MPHSAAALAEALRLTLSVKKELTDLGGRLRLSLHGDAAQAVRVPTAHMDPVPGVDGLWWLQLPCAYPDAPTCTRLLVGGLAGSRSEKAQVPHDVQLRLLEGTLDWWQESFGHNEAGQPITRRYHKGDTWKLVKDEAHGFTALEDFLCYNVFTPFFPA